MARDSAESRFREALNQHGGPEQVLLVGELWDRIESRALLEEFLREIFPEEQKHIAGVPQCKDSQDIKTPHELSLKNKGTREQKSNNNNSNTNQEKTSPHSNGPRPTQDRTLRFPLVFFLCRPKSLKLTKQQYMLREILRDLRVRLHGGGAVIGVVMQTRGNGNCVKTELHEVVEMAEDVKAVESGSPAGLTALDNDVASLLLLLQSVFPPGSPAEVRAAALIPGQEETRRELQRVSYEALSAAADNQQTHNSEAVLFNCFPWRKRRRKREAVQKGNAEEGTTLTVFDRPNGTCMENTTEA
ncbi:uncharacterized protein C2orf72 homolog [Bombina bombina]|uniref:uncharacterized protein C2orf72 homolog n=1 Tax=Bombina bombina TaxID=8345 RepID=UPI00235AA994|nr:uncharacterized protein C2orf72 homolog [Bombina bombina]